MHDINTKQREFAKQEAAALLADHITLVLAIMSALLSRHILDGAEINAIRRTDRSCPGI